jgi:hypothetical protein
MMKNEYTQVHLPVESACAVVYISENCMQEDEGEDQK